MAYDTVRLRSPALWRTHRPHADAAPISPVFESIKAQCILREGTDLETGEQLYHIHTGELLGSWDSRISVQPKTEEWATDGNGRTILTPCEPYLIVEASVHKLELGQNVFGGPETLDAACAALVGHLQKCFGVTLPDYRRWQLLKIDWACVYNLRLPAIREFFDGLQLLNFPRRAKKAGRYEMAAHFPGKTTTIKLYHKGSEFKVHDRDRLKRFFRLYYGTIYQDQEHVLKATEKKLKALQRLADNRLRVEVSIHDDKLRYDFDGKLPRVEQVTDQYVKHLHAKEVERLLREGKQGMETVRTTQQVIARLNTVYGDLTGMRLYGFWASLVTLGDEATKREYSRTVFFRNRKLLEDAGVSWRGSDVHVVANNAHLPADFVPIPTDIRLCCSRARSRPEFAINSEMIIRAA